ncbi:MAG: hypothetical protein NTV43_14735 [Methylococcales bacterium]|nr:hypothetical protein [Methylococcales bacterium]
MALVIWLFAGGGEAELGEREGNIKGIVHFFEKHFPDFTFQRITPVRSKRPPHRVNSNAAINALGKTGVAFSKQIKAKLDDKIKQGDPLCDAILILDDLDCCCNDERKSLFNDTVNQAGNGAFKEIRRIIGFAAPELEAWVIADWSNTIAKHIDFTKNHQAMQGWLKANQVCFDVPEKFSFYNESKNSCDNKLSELLIESSRQINQTVYSKARHTSFLLHESLKPDVVARKCPIFKDFFTQLQRL